MNPYVLTTSPNPHSNRVTLPPMMMYPESDHLMRYEQDNQNLSHHHHHHHPYASSSLFHHPTLNSDFDSDYKNLSLIPSSNFKSYIKAQDSISIPIPIPIKPTQVSHPTKNFNDQDHPQSPFTLNQSHQDQNHQDQRLSLSLLLAAANASDANLPTTPCTSIHHLNQTPTHIYTQNASSPSWRSNLTGSSDQLIPPSSPHTPLDTPIYQESEMKKKDHYRIYSDEFDSRKIPEFQYTKPMESKKEEKSNERISDEERWRSLMIENEYYEKKSLREVNPNPPKRWKVNLPSSISKSNDDQINPSSQLKKRKNKRSITWSSEKPKQGKKKRSVGYVRPIIKHRKRVGQRLLDMLKNSPVPSKSPPMEVNRARCFPFAEMESKLNEWYGLQIEWPTDGIFKMNELRSTRRMRQDELDRLDQTLDSGLVRIRLADWVLEEEPFRSHEFSYPSDGIDLSLDEHDQIEFESDEVSTRDMIKSN
ncbi:hypothetical protein DFH28DRAFT_924471 [Melampsora americana]|nr:hypothetical protein DFH28DRAFT_924471 [Melampsora americana]